MVSIPMVMSVKTKTKFMRSKCCRSSFKDEKIFQLNVEIDSLSCEKVNTIELERKKRKRARARERERERQKLVRKITGSLQDQS